MKEKSLKARGQFTEQSVTINTKLPPLELRKGKKRNLALSYYFSFINHSHDDYIYIHFLLRLSKAFAQCLVADGSLAPLFGGSVFGGGSGNYFKLQLVSLGGIRPGS